MRARLFLSYTALVLLALALHPLLASAGVPGPAAVTLIAALCLADPQVERVTVRVEKPGALRFSRSVGVEIERGRGDHRASNRAFVALGSNIQPERYLPAASKAGWK